MYKKEILKAYARYYTRRNIVFDNMKSKDISELSQWEGELWNQCEDELIEIHTKYHGKT